MNYLKIRVRKLCIRIFPVHLVSLRTEKGG
jgi:hypothetical protein